MLANGDPAIEDRPQRGRRIRFYMFHYLRENGSYIDFGQLAALIRIYVKEKLTGQPANKPTGSSNLLP